MQSLFSMFKQLCDSEWQGCEKQIESLSGTFLKVWSILCHSVQTERETNLTLNSKKTLPTQMLKRQSSIQNGAPTADADFITYMLAFLIETVKLVSES